MRRNSSRFSVVVLLASIVGMTGIPAFQVQPQLPPSDEKARDRLNSSPRHAEWVKIDASSDKINAWLVYPERKEKAGVVIVIHEIYGLTDWIRAVADQLAAEGFVAIAPDLLSGKGPGRGGTESVDRDGAVALIRSLQWNEIVARLNATAEYATSLPAARKGFATIGFCWGGRTSFAYAAEQPKLRAAVVYYGTSPPAEALGKIQAAVLGLYGGDDARVNQTIGPADAEMKRLGKRYEYEIYDGAGHGFLRAQEARDGANLGASEKAWPRTIALLRQQLGRD